MRASELAERIGAVCEGNTASAEITEVSSFSLASPRSLIFVAAPRYWEQALASSAGAMIVPSGASLPGAEDGCGGKAVLYAANPRLAFALAAAALRCSEGRPQGIAASAVIDVSAVIDSTAWIGELAVIGAAVRIGARCRIGAGCVLEAGVVMGDDCELAPRVVVCSGTSLGERVMVKAGAILGSEGFGFVPDPQNGRYHKFPQIGRLVIGNDVEIGANTTIDRGALDATILGDGVKLDNLVQIAHNVQLGRNVVVASQTGISGSSVLEDNVLVGGQVGIAEHVRIEEGAILGAQCGIPSKKILRGKGVVFWGTPARPIAEYLRELGTLARLTKMKK